ncbi:hypothetical protein MNBD_GAMMA04-1805 [hydrothermal vent metagenome]|uniref:Lipopolysaccharide assembly protein A domain-containing protein n=1 Tax=hydrothermal vent metagenome TaxID=652676 RepID=A0A3B0VXK7_9ZZZZ
MLKLFIFIIIIVLLVLGIVLGVLNPNQVNLDLFLIKTTLPLGLALAITLVIGALLGSAASSFKISQLKWLLRKQVKANKKQLNEIIQLKKESTARSKELVNIEKTG